MRMQRGVVAGTWFLCGITFSLWLVGSCLDRRCEVVVDAPVSANEEVLPEAGEPVETVARIQFDPAVSASVSEWTAVWSNWSRRGIGDAFARRPQATLRAGAADTLISVVGSDPGAVEEMVEGTLSRLFPVPAAGSSGGNDSKTGLLRAARLRTLGLSRGGRTDALAAEMFGLSSDLRRFGIELGQFARMETAPITVSSDPPANSPWPRLVGAIELPPAIGVSTSASLGEKRMAVAAENAAVASAFVGSWPPLLAALPHLVSMETLPEPDAAPLLPRAVKIRWTLQTTREPVPWLLALSPFFLGIVGTLSASRSCRDGAAHAGVRSTTSTHVARLGEIVPATDFLARIPARMDRRGRVLAFCSPDPTESTLDAVAKSFHGTSGRVLRMSLDTGAPSVPSTDANLPGLLDVLSGSTPIEMAIVGNSEGGWRMSGGSSSHTSESDAMSVSHLIDVLAMVFDPVVVGMGGIPMHSESLAWADHVVVGLPAGNTPTGKWRALADGLDAAGVPAENRTVVSARVSNLGAETRPARSNVVTDAWKIERLVGEQPAAGSPIADRPV
ncbi:MAG: hypothetical protein ACKO5K_08075 [Armatimonadota bacterium]